MAILDVFLLKAYLGKRINTICDCNYFSDHDNHCAHFVSHALGYNFGMTCKRMSGRGTGTGASIRVHELFSQCAQVGEWKDKPQGNYLAFVTAASNVNLLTKTMVNVPKKHVGIFCNNVIFHYSNSQHKVVYETPEIFARHYPGHNIKVFYRTFPV